jgi:hypothetical protein
MVHKATEAGHGNRAVCLRSLEAGIVGSNPTLSIDTLCVYAFIPCLCCPVFRWRPCHELITRPRSPTVFNMTKKLINQPYAPNLERERKKTTEPTQKELDNFQSKFYIKWWFQYRNFILIYRCIYKIALN